MTLSLHESVNVVQKDEKIIFTISANVKLSSLANSSVRNIQVIMIRDSGRCRLNREGDNG